MSHIARIALIHTNDLHSHLDIWPHTVTVIRQELARAEAAGRPAVYVNAGDQMEMSERTCNGTRGRVALDLLADAGCRAFTVGNNEVMRLQLAELSELAASSPFPWLGSNMRDHEGGRFAGIQDWAILPVGSVKVGFLGLTPLGPATAAMGIVHEEPPAVIARCAAELREAGADLVVHLSHQGLPFDRAHAEAGLGLDLIIGGDSHDALEQPEVVAGTPIAQAGEFGRYVGVLELDIDLATKRLVRCEGRLLPVDPVAVPADPSAAALVAAARGAAEQALAAVVAVLPEALPHDPVGESRLGPVVAEALRRKAGAELGLAFGGTAVHGFAAGPVTRSDVMAAMPALFVPALLEMSGATLEALLAQSEDPQCYGNRLGAAGMRPRGSAIGRLFAAGVARATGGEWLVNGEPLDAERVYRVGAPSLLAFPQAGYPAAAGVRIVQRFMPELVRETFEEALRNGLTR